ncbi:MAG: glycosyltransferase family 9 protein [Verrucomicrobia bacterium]|nr:glycosyltransferase family 9 protein [Verrucomicrobiota bacterium]
MKVLILKPSSLGDVVHALPVARLLKLQFPQAEIHWWILRGLMPLLETDPDLDVLHPFDREGWSNPSVWMSAASGLSAMRRSRYEWVIDLQGLFRSGLMSWLAEGELTLGLDDHGEGARGFYDVTLTRPSATTHAVDYNLTVCRALNIPVDRPFEWLPRRPRVAETVAKQLGRLGSGKVIAIQPGARWETKRWPIAFFVELARRLQSELGEVRLLILGGANERGLSGMISRASIPGCHDLAGTLSLPELVEWIRLCDLLITNDTGPMHLGAAMDVPTLALFGPTTPWRTGPYGQMDRVLSQATPCAPCFQGVCNNAIDLACLRGISPERVAQRAIEILEAPRRSSPWAARSSSANFEAAPGEA